MAKMFNENNINRINKSQVVPGSPMVYIKDGASGDCMGVLPYSLLGIEVKPTDRWINIDKSSIQAGTACIEIDGKVIPLCPHPGWYFYEFFKAFFPDGNLQAIAIPYCAVFSAPGEKSIIRGDLTCEVITQDRFSLYNMSDDIFQASFENGETYVETIPPRGVTLRLNDGNLVFSVSNFNPEFWKITQQTMHGVKTEDGGFSITLPYRMQRINNYEDPDGNLDYRTTTTLYLQDLTFAPLD